MAMQNERPWRWCLMLGSTVAVGWNTAGPLLAQSEQVVEVTIKDFRFVTKQPTLRLGSPTMITIRNDDKERHDFGSTMFEGIPTQIEKTALWSTAAASAACMSIRSETRPYGLT